MKYLRLTIILPVLALLSCNKMESGAGDGVVAFQVYTGRDIVKAGITDVTADNLTAFKVAAYLKGTDVTYFKAEETATKQSSGEFTTATQYYWPISGSLDFFAYRTAVSTSISNTDGTATLSYTLPSDASDDLVVASALDCSRKTLQPLSFAHVLSKINSLTLKAKSGDASAASHYKYVVEDLYVEAQGTGIFTFGSSSWALSGSSNTYRFSTMGAGESVSFLGDRQKTLELSQGVKDQLAMLPQTVKIKLKYSVWYSPLDNPGTDDWMKIMESTETPKEAPIKMGNGKAYGITLQLPNDGTAISFSIDVTEWLDESFSSEEFAVNPEIVEI